VTSPNPLSFNAWVQTIASMAVVTAVETSGVYGFVDPPLQAVLPQILAYAEGRIQRDINALNSMTSNTYTLTAGQPVFPLPIGDFFTLQTLEICTTSGGSVVNAMPLLQTSKEMIQNCYSGLASANTPQYYAFYGDNFGSEQDSVMNILLGPPPNYAYTLRVTGTAKQPSLYANASAGIADTEYTYISQYLPDLLVMASMVFISAYQRNFSATSAETDMSMSYEKQYQILRVGAITDEDKRRGQASAWTSYATPTSATPTR
jgi:hypothetical protein